MDDNKVMEMLAQILQGQTELKIELKQDIQSVKTTVDNLEIRVNNLGVLMEKVNVNVKIVGEGLSSHREQNDRQFADLKAFIREENDVVKSVLKQHSTKMQKVR